VPGFGGFVARPVSAQFSKTGNMLLPPGKSLVFNKNLSNNDGLLAAHIMQKQSLQFKEAVAKIEQWVSEGRRQLETKKRLELESTGLLYYNSENTLLFEPSLQKSHEMNSFGLVAVNAVKLSKEDNTQTIEEKEFVDRTLQGRIAGTKTLMRISVVVSSILLFTFLLLFTAKQLPISNALASLNPFASEEPVYKTQNYNLETLLNSTEKKTAKELVTNTVKLSSTSEKTFVVRPDTVHTDKTAVIKSNFNSASIHTFEGPFQIVVGCFAVKQNAQKLIHQLKNQNTEAGISGQNAKGLYVVSVAGFTSESLARAKLNKVKQNFPSAWMMVR